MYQMILNLISNQFNYIGVYSYMYLDNQVANKANKEDDL